MNSRNPSVQNQDRRFQALLNDGRDMVLVFLSAQLNDFFGSTDEALLDFAEHAENNALQSRFFEAMGAVRRFRSEIEHIFREEIHEGFEKFFHSPTETEARDIPIEELALINQEEMDESVAVENLISRCRDSYFLQLNALAQRLSVLNHGHHIKEEDIPGGPTHLANSFRASIHSLAIDLKAKIVLYALFDKVVMRQLQGLYDEFNNNLKSAGILPNLKPTFIRPGSHASSTPKNKVAQKGTDGTTKGHETEEEERSGMNGGAQEPLGEELFTSILELLAARHHPAAVAPPVPVEHPLGTATETGRVMPPGATAQPGGMTTAAGEIAPPGAAAHFGGTTTAAGGVAPPGAAAQPGGTITAAGEVGPPGTAAQPGDTPIAADEVATPSTGALPWGAASDSREPVARDGEPSATSAADAHLQLISTLDNIRPQGVGQGRGVLSDLEALPKVAADPNFLDNLKSVLYSEREEIYTQVPPEQMHGIDADTIDLIGMLFEYMLNDPLLPNVAKALLSHLHTPYLKLSLTDATLLVDSEHPARLLLDLLVEAGGEWVYENDINRGIFPAMQNVVDRVLKELDHNETLFPELLEYFEDTIDDYRRKTEAIEQRAQESVKGREKLQIAKQRAALEIHRRISGVNLPTQAEKFLTQAWTDRLVFILLRQEEGELSEEWNRSLQTADELIWIFSTGGAEASEMEIQQTGSAVKEEIEQALESLGGYHQSYLAKLFELLDDPAAVAEWREKCLEVPFPEPPTEDYEPLLQPGMPAAHGGEGPQQGDAAPESWDEHLPSTERAIPSEQILTEPEQEMLEKLQRLPFGTWFEFRGEGEESLRLKLSWLSPLTATCMFVDRYGAQALIKTLVDSARMLASGEAKIIPKPKQQFVERAMLAIKNTLQRSMQAAD